MVIFAFVSVCHSKQYTPKDVSFGYPVKINPGEEFLKFQLKACANGIILLTGTDRQYLYSIFIGVEEYRNYILKFIR